MQDDTSIENLRALTATARDYGVYRGVSGPLNATPPCEVPASVAERAKLIGMTGHSASNMRAGVCFPWEEKAKELPSITGDEKMVRDVWEQIDGLGNMFIWQLLLSF
jgi:hypothetical protein